jgi:hypothetical protein
VKPTRAQVVGTLLLALVFFAYLVARYARLFE